MTRLGLYPISTNGGDDARDDASVCDGTIDMKKGIASNVALYAANVSTSSTVCSMRDSSHEQTVMAAPASTRKCSANGAAPLFHWHALVGA